MSGIMLMRRRTIVGMSLRIKIVLVVTLACRGFLSQHRTDRERFAALLRPWARASIDDKFYRQYEIGARPCPRDMPTVQPEVWIWD